MTRTLAALAAALISTTAYATNFDAASPIVKNEQIVRGWTGSAFANPEGTRWSHCVISSMQHKRGVESFVMLKTFESGNFGLTLSARDWKMTPGKVYVIGLQADDGDILEAEATATSRDTMVVHFEPEAGAQTQATLAFADALFVYRGKDLLLGYTMQNSAKALSWLNSCTKNGMAMNGTDFDQPAKPAVNPKTPKLDM